MSDASPGEGWWQASDTKWYPPEPAPAPPAQANPAPLPPPPVVVDSPVWKRSWVLIIAAFLLIMVVLAILATEPPPDERSWAPVGSSSTAAEDPGRA
jgi:hypothetical protein